MKSLLSLFAIFASMSLLSAQLPELVQLPLGDSLVERRLAFVESQMGISRTDWKLVLPKDYSARVVFRKAGKEEPLKAISLKSGTTNTLFFATVVEGQDLKVSFGANNEEAGILTAQPREWKSTFGFPDGAKDFRLFELSFSGAQEIDAMWCEVSFQKH